MQDLIATIILTAAFYLWLFCPRHTATADPVQYFPTVEETTEPETPDAEKEAIAYAADLAKPITIVEPRPAAAFVPNPVKITPETAANDLHSLSIRTLKKMASAAKIKRYSSLTKAQLIQALTA